MSVTESCVFPLILTLVSLFLFFFLVGGVWHDAKGKSQALHVEPECEKE